MSVQPVGSPRVAYLGPPGTFCNEAAMGIFQHGEELIPLPTIPAVLECVKKGDSAFGVVPIENSIHGEVTTTMDSLVFDFVNLYVCNEIVVPVSFCAFTKSNDQEPIRAILSHPHAIAQCRRFIDKLGATVKNTDSTAKACEEVALSEEPGLVAIASESAGQIYGLHKIGHAIEDHPGAGTKFYAIGSTFFPPTRSSKSLLVLVPKVHSTGIFVKMLASFSTRALDLNSIHSRPLRSELGRYCFIITVEGHIKENALNSAVREILGMGVIVKFLGSFANWEGMLPTAPYEGIGGSTEDASGIDQWLASVSTAGRLP